MDQDEKQFVLTMFFATAVAPLLLFLGIWLVGV
jgi:hypothetical protein